MKYQSTIVIKNATWLLLGVVLIGANLRASFTSMPPRRSFFTGGSRAGWLHDHFGGWQGLLSICIIAAITQAITGYLAGRTRQIH